MQRLPPVHKAADGKAKRGGSDGQILRKTCPSSVSLGARPPPTPRFAPSPLTSECFLRLASFTSLFLVASSSLLTLPPPRGCTRRPARLVMSSGSLPCPTLPLPSLALPSLPYPAPSLPSLPFPAPSRACPVAQPQHSPTRQTLAAHCYSKLIYFHCFRLTRPQRVSV